MKTQRALAFAETLTSRRTVADMSNLTLQCGTEFNKMQVKLAVRAVLQSHSVFESS